MVKVVGKKRVDKIGIDKFEVELELVNLRWNWN